MRGGRAEAADDDRGDNRSSIELDARRFGPEALAGLGDFFQIEAIFHFDRVPGDKVEAGARCPGSRTD